MSKLLAPQNVFDLPQSKSFSLCWTISRHFSFDLNVHLILHSVPYCSFTTSASIKIGRVTIIEKAHTYIDIQRYFLIHFCVDRDFWRLNLILCTLFLFIEAEALSFRCNKRPFNLGHPLPRERVKVAENDLVGRIWQKVVIVYHW